jgi:hypothetical protein
LLTLSVNWSGTSIDASHSVEAEQFEPGLADEEQAHAHLLNLEVRDLTLQARIGVTERVGLEFEMPYRQVRVEADFEGSGGERREDFVSIHHRTETVSGLGDISLYARFRLTRPLAGGRWVVDVLSGVAVPTGDTEPDPFELGEEGHQHQHIFFGTGTYDPLLGVEVYHPSSSLPTAGWLRLRTPVSENSFGYRAGARVSAGIAVNPSLGVASWSFLGQLELYHEEPSRWDDRNARNSGRTDLIGNLGVFWTPAAAWDLHVVVKIPENLSSRGGQLELSPTVSVGGSYSVSLRARG